MGSQEDWFQPPLCAVNLGTALPLHVQRELVSQGYFLRGSSPPGLPGLLCAGMRASGRGATSPAILAACLAEATRGLIKPGIVFFLGSL